MENAIIYDYKTVKVKREVEALVCDAYENLGWELTNTSSVEGSLFYINLSFKRDRKAKNKVELLKLQEKVDNTIANIDSLQRKKKNAGMIESLSCGVIGTLVFGGGMSMCLLLHGIGFMLGGIALGIVGAGIWALAYPLLKKRNKKMQTQIQPLIETEYDKLADMCENAVQLQNKVENE